MYDDDVLIFVGSDRELMKLLRADDGKLVMYVQQLGAGRFKIPLYNKGRKTYPVTWRDHVEMVEGIKKFPENRLRRLRAVRRKV